MKKVVVGLSGGVDSSVAAYLLKKQGYEVAGLFMINWHDTTGTLEGDCSWKDDKIFAELVARKLDIPFHTIDFSEQYRKRVVDYMFLEYKNGRTPNPDILCNREVKFDLFQQAAKDMKADYMATGHYARIDKIKNNNKTYSRLLAGLDRNKDQSYFLCQLSQYQLKTALFPIGELNKSEVRKIAQENGLVTAERKDSQGICFVGKVDLPTFLQQQLTPKKGDIIEIEKNSSLYDTIYIPSKIDNLSDEELKKTTTIIQYKPQDGIVAGTHNGAQYFTIGQRKGLNVGGKIEPLFVISTDTHNNIIYTGQGHDHPGLNRYGLFIPKNEIHWIRPGLEMNTGEKRNYSVRIRYRQPLQKAMVYMEEDGIYIVFEKPQRGITPGQFAAWYDKDELVGSGVIS